MVLPEFTQEFFYSLNDVDTSGKVEDIFFKQNVASFQKASNIATIYFSILYSRSYDSRDIDGKFRQL